jgi:hypothetical protein
MVEMKVFRRDGTTSWQGRVLIGLLDEAALDAGEVAALPPVGEK